ncbi:DUF7916 family protein [Enterococcus sp. BWB1-3]
MEDGAEIQAISNGDFPGCTMLEKVTEFSISLKGKPYMYFRMASRNR